MSDRRSQGVNYVMLIVAGLFKPTSDRRSARAAGWLGPTLDCHIRPLTEINAAAAAPVMIAQKLLSGGCYA
jgi:hypothetical protein